MRRRRNPPRLQVGSKVRMVPTALGELPGDYFYSRSRLSWPDWSKEFYRVLEGRTGTVKEIQPGNEPDFTTAILVEWQYSPYEEDFIPYAHWMSPWEIRLAAIQIPEISTRRRRVTKADIIAELLRVEGPRYSDLELLAYDRSLHRLTKAQLKARIRRVEKKAELARKGITMKNPKEEKALYTAVILDDPRDLEDWWLYHVGPLLPKRYSHHMTIKFKPTPEEVASLPLGAQVALEIVGFAADRKGQAVQVEVVSPSGVRSTNPIPHITVATDGTSPVYSNELLSRGAVPAEGRDKGFLYGRVGYVSTRGRDVF